MSIRDCWLGQDERGRYLVTRELADWFDVEAYDRAIAEAERWFASDPR